MKLYIGVHHTPPADIGSDCIILGTQAVLSNYVMGPTNPATHAFVAVELEDTYWILDGKPTRAEWSPALKMGNRFQGLGINNQRPLVQAIWCIAPKDPDGIKYGLHMAQSITHAAYNWEEIAVQAAVAFGALPGFQKFKALGRVEVFHHSFICTHVCLKTLEAVGDEVAEAMKSMPDLYPERLAHYLEAGEGKWCERLRVPS